MTLDHDTRRDLRRRGHQLKAVVRTGAAGLTEPVLEEIERALYDHELVKVKFVAGDRDERRSMIERTLERTGAELVQRTGQVALIFRPRPE